MCVEREIDLAELSAADLRQLCDELKTGFEFLREHLDRQTNATPTDTRYREGFRDGLADAAMICYRIVMHLERR